MERIEKLSTGESTLTNRYQTTIPQIVRKILGLDKNDKITYTIQQNGTVLLSRSDKNESDPVLNSFLDLLANDISSNPDNVQLMDAELIQRADSLVSGIHVDLDSPLLNEDE